VTRRISILGFFVIAGLSAAACAPDATTTAPTIAPSSRFGSPLHRGSTIRGWISPTAKAPFLYVSLSEQSVVDIYSVPSYSLVGQITDGIDFPEGIATDKAGNLYVTNLEGGTVTVYPAGQTSPSRTLDDANGPIDVALTKNKYVLVGDNGGGIDVFPPNASSPSSRLTNPYLAQVGGVGADAHNNVYAVGNNVSYAPVVVEFKHLGGSGTNLNLSDLVAPSGVLVDSRGNVVISDYSLPGVNIYPPHSSSPSATIANTESPGRSAFNKAESLIYVPEGTTYAVNVYDYPGGSLVTTITTTGFTRGAALSPPAKP
jgi:hypothetical protein